LTKRFIMAKGGFIKYDIEFIIQTLKCLAKNSYNLCKTGRETGVHADTIGRWREKYEDIYRDKILETKIVQIAKSVSPDIEEDRESVATDIQNVKDMIISRMAVLVPVATNLDQLSRAYKILYECVNDVKNGNARDEKSYLQIINMQINAMAGNLEETKDTDYEQADD